MLDVNRVNPEEKLVIPMLHPMCLLWSHKDVISIGSCGWIGIITELTVLLKVIWLEGRPFPLYTPLKLLQGYSHGVFHSLEIHIFVHNRTSFTIEMCIF